MTVQNMLRKWLPLTDAVFRMVTKCMPNPIAAQEHRINILINPKTYEERSDVGIYGEISREMKLVTRHISTCHTNQVLNSPAADPSTNHVVVYIAKMLPIRVAELSVADRDRLFRQLGTNHSTPESQPTEVLMAIGRVFSGVLTNEVPLYLLSNAHDPFEYSSTLNASDQSQKEKRPTVTKVPINTLGLYTCLGPSVFPTHSVAAGNIVGIVGLNRTDSGSENPASATDAPVATGSGGRLMVMKTATLASTWKMFPLLDMTFQSKPMVRVAVGPKSYNEVARFEEGLRQLYLYDPVVEIDVDNSTGQHTITCLGELHLEQCLKALSERFAKCEVLVSPPIVPFRETITCLSNDVSREGYLEEWECETVTETKIREQLENVDAIVTSENTSDTKTGSMGATDGENCKYNPLTHLPAPWSTTPGLTPLSHGKTRKIFACSNFPFAVTVRCAILNRDILMDFELYHNELTLIFEQFRQQLKTHGNKLCPALEHYLDSISENVSRILLSVYDTIFGQPGHTNHNNSNTGGVTHGNSKGRLKKLLDVLVRIISAGPSPDAPVNLLMFDKTCAMDISLENEVGDPELPLDRDQSRNAHNIFAFNPFKEFDTDTGSNDASFINAKTLFDVLYQRLVTPLSLGFHHCCTAGHLMQEPVHGVIFVIDRLEVSSRMFDINQGEVCNNDNLFSVASCLYGDSTGIVPLITTTSTVINSFESGLFISEIRDLFRNMLLSYPARIFEPIYTCELQCDASMLGNLYGVLLKRRSSITQETVIEGTSLFLLSVFLPVIESFGFSLELLKKTSGKGTSNSTSNLNSDTYTSQPQLSYSHWTLLEEDPFWKPTTEEELEMYGDLINNNSTSAENANTSSTNNSSTVYSKNNAFLLTSPLSNGVNTSKRIVDAVRKRKGLVSESRLVVAADKQRTLSKKK